MTVCYRKKYVGLIRMKQNSENASQCNFFCFESIDSIDQIKHMNRFEMAFAINAVLSLFIGF